jgi:hypothetical protein
MTSGAAALPQAKTPPRPRAWLAASVWVLVLALVAAAATLAFVLHRGDPEGAARIANAEVEALIERGEQIVARVVVKQRLWWDYYRHTYGVLAATDRRLMYVGVPPEPLLHNDPGPPELVTQAFPYSRGLAVTRVRLFMGRTQGVRFVGATGTGRFGIAPRDSARLDAVLAVADRAQAVLRAAADAERRAAEAAAADARRPIYHLVQPGEALGTIARRYGVTVESLTVWNDLASERIAVGSRLLVRPGREP